MKLKILTIAICVLILNGCALVAMGEASDIEGTWVSSSTYHSGSNNYYVYYNFNPTNIGSGGDHSGTYTIRGYRSNDFWGSNYAVLEHGSYSTDYISSELTLRKTGEYNSRTLKYDLTYWDLKLRDNNYWSSTQLHLKKL